MVSVRMINRCVGTIDQRISLGLWLEAHMGISLGVGHYT